MVILLLFFSLPKVSKNELLIYHIVYKNISGLKIAAGDSRLFYDLAGHYCFRNITYDIHKASSKSFSQVN